MLGVGKKEDDNFSSVVSLYAENALAEWRLIKRKDIQLLTSRKEKSCY
jgi:hypothetical protein